MRNYINDSYKISKLIDDAKPDDVDVVCKLLDKFWLKYCERTHRLFFLYWTSHNHAAKGAWAMLDHELRQKICELNDSSDVECTEIVDEPKE